MKRNKSVVDTELAGLTPEEILHVRTGLEDTANERVTYFLHNKVQSLYKQKPGSTKSLGRPGMRISFGLNDKAYELPRKQTTKQRFDLDDSNWQNKTKSSNFLKSKQGVGGGHIPGKEIGLRKKRTLNDDLYFN